MIKKIVKIFIIIVTSIALIILLLVALDKINEARCYNLPLNTFYEDQSCLRYKEKIDE